MKKGFTLVELLAVIAILAILVIIALPNVLELFKNAGKNAFLREVQTVYTEANKKYIASQFGGVGEEKIYTNMIEEKKLNIQNGSGEFRYIVVVKTDGHVKSLSVSNGTYRYTNSVTLNNAKDININDIEETTYGASYYGETEDVEYVYSNSSVGGYYDSLNNIPTGAFVRTTKRGNGDMKYYAGFRNNYQVYYIKGSNENEYEMNKLVMASAFKSNECNETATYYKCKSGSLSVYAYKNGNVSSMIGSIYCTATSSAASCSRYE